MEVEDGPTLERVYAVLENIPRDDLHQFFYDRFPLAEIPQEFRVNKSTFISFLLRICDRNEVERLLEMAAEYADDRDFIRLEEEHRQAFASWEAHHAEEDAFLALPTNDEVLRMHQRFYQATGNDALKFAVCAACSRESLRSERTIHKRPLDSLPNRQRLIPAIAHPAHDIYEGGVLLEPNGVFMQEGRQWVNICRQCLDALNSTTEGPPRYSLANGLWTGRVPLELQTLTVCEQMLLAHLYPRVYSYKLFTKSNRGPLNPAQLYSAMRGTVTTYQMDPSSIAEMLTGNLMPRPLAILPSVIAVTMVGVKQTVEPWLRKTFRVRRYVVRDALLWLIQNNPRYYGNVHISHQHLNALPEDDVPEELRACVASNEAEGRPADETDGYVPLEEEDPGECNISLGKEMILSRDNRDGLGTRSSAHTDFGGHGHRTEARI